MMRYLCSFIWTLTPVLLIVLIACQHAPSDQPHTRYENGIPHIQNPDRPRESDVPEITFVEELRIGSETDDNYLFQSAWLLDVDRHGNIYVLDYGARHIRKFDSTGTYVLTIGHKGQGPGEFKCPRQFFIDTRDRVIVYDSCNKRISIFTASGKLVHEFRTEELIPDLPGLLDFMALPDDEILYSTGEIDWEAERLTRIFKVMTLDGQPKDELFAVSYPI